MDLLPQEFEDAFEVTGSDISAMNGVYIRTDDWDGHPLYTNQGLTAVLYFRSSLGNQGAWFVRCNNNNNVLAARSFFLIFLFFFCPQCRPQVVNARTLYMF